jgi:hypothetical protein
MTTRPVPKRHWRSYGTEPLPTGAEALEEPFRAFPSWFMRVTCDQCGCSTRRGWRCLVCHPPDHLAADAIEVRP